MTHEKTAKELLRGFIADIEAMQCDPPDMMLEFEQDHWYGPFSVGTEDLMEGYTYVQWPCLGILLEEAKKLCAK